MAFTHRETTRGRPQARSRVLRLGAAGAGLALLGGLVGLGAAASGPQVARPPVAVLVITVRVMLYVLLALGVVVGAVLVLALWPERRRGKRGPEDEWEEYHEPPNLHWAIKLAMVATPLALLVGLVVLALRATHGTGSAIPGAVPLPPMPAPNAPLGTGPGGLDTGHAALVITVAIVALIVATSFVLLRRSRLPLPRPVEAVRAVAAGIDDGLDALRRERDPRRAVVLAYAAMERALARRGWPRADAEAPFEYLDRLSRSAHVNPSHLRGLTELFEVARFSQHTVDEPMRAAAVARLELVRADLEAEPSTA